MRLVCVDPPCSLRPSGAWLRRLRRHHRRAPKVNDRVGNALIAARLDAEIARLLSGQQKFSGVSLRELSRRSGVKLTRLGDILRRGRPATVSEVNAIAAELGLIGWRVMQDAEHRIGAGDCAEGVTSASAEPEPVSKTGIPASSAGYRARWAGVRYLPHLVPTPEEQERMAALAGSTDEDFGYPADIGEEPQD